MCKNGAFGAFCPEGTVFLCLFQVSGEGGYYTPSADEEKTLPLPPYVQRRCTFNLHGGAIIYCVPLLLQFARRCIHRGFLSARKTQHEAALCSYIIK